MVFQKAASEPAGKTKKSTAWLLMPCELTHRKSRVAIVDSVIAKIFNPCKYWTVTIQPFHKTLNLSVPVLFIASFYGSALVCSVFFCSIQCFCSIIQCIFLFSYWNCIPGISIPTSYTTTITQLINIIQQTAPSLP
jgi:hypothetical protein